MNLDFDKLNAGTFIGQFSAKLGCDPRGATFIGKGKPYHCWYYSIG
jgi:hypothetical protein